MRNVDDIEQQIQQSKAGTLFFVSDLAKTGNNVFISRLLSEFAEKGLFAAWQKESIICLLKRITALLIVIIGAIATAA